MRLLEDTHVNYRILIKKIRILGDFTFKSLALIKSLIK